MLENSWDRNGETSLLALNAPGRAYPFEEMAVGLPIDESAGGLALPDCVANTQCLLLVSRSCADYMTGAFQLGKCEVLPVHLINEKQRVHARDYAMMNPIGAIDCLDRSRSELRMSSDGEVLAVKKYVLNEGKIPRGLDLFRVKDDVFQYFFSQRLVDSLGAEGYSNFVFEPVPVAGSGV